MISGQLGPGHLAAGNKKGRGSKVNNYKVDKKKRRLALPIQSQVPSCNPRNPRLFFCPLHNY